MFDIFDAEMSPVWDSMYGDRKYVDYSALVESFNEFTTSKLDINEREYTLYTKLAFAEFENGKIEKGFAYFLLGHVGDYISITEICFARVTSVPELYNMLVLARDCENFVHFFVGKFYGVAETTGANIADDAEDVMTHLGVRRGISFGNAFVTEEAVFGYGDDLFDGWLGCYS